VHQEAIDLDAHLVSKLFARIQARFISRAWEKPVDD
jgi:hypothetical protein